MIPAAFIVLDALPLTPNGKIDRQALPAPDQRQLSLGEAFVAPRTPTEELLAGIWAHVLGVASVGLHDNFFLMGGHSLLGTQLVTRVNQHFGVDLGLREVFEAPTIEELAACVEGKIAQKIAEMPEEEVQRFLQKAQAT